MFVQVIHGRTSDAEGLRASFDRWMEDLAPGAVGWLGSTGGVTQDGRVIMVARFESEDAARRNSTRPEQDRWWAETARHFDGEPSFQDSTDIVVDLQGDPDQATFVQVMRGRTSDPKRARELMTLDPEQWASFRPDILGSVEVGHEDGRYTVVLYFTSEAEAREGERREVPLDLRATMEEMEKLSVEDTEYFDLPDPMIRSAAPSTGRDA
jgi:hypothetical protein